MFRSQHFFICQQASNHFKKKQTKVHKQKQFRGVLLLYWIEDLSFGTKKTKRMYFSERKPMLKKGLVVNIGAGFLNIGNMIDWQKLHAQHLFSPTGLSNPLSFPLSI